MHTQRAKGKKFELDIVHLLEAVFRPEAGWKVRRGLQGRGGEGCPDVEVLQHGNPPSVLHIEACHSKTVPVRRKLAQACGDSRAGALPIVIAKDDGEEPFAVMPISVLLDLLALLARDHEVIVPVDLLPKRGAA